MKILFAGTPIPAAVVLEHLLADTRFEVAGVITQPDARRGRGRTLHPSPVAKVATHHEIPVHKFESLKAQTDSGAAAREVLEEYRADGVEAIAVVAYGNLIPADLLNVVPLGWVNLHYSLLPRWRGAAPVQAAIAAGDATTGATIFRIEEGLDSGPIIAKSSQDIALDATADDVLTDLTYSGRELLADALVDLSAGTITPEPQPTEGVTHAPKIDPSDARINWDAKAEVIQRVARAHTPAPGAWTTLQGERFKIGLMMPASEAEAAEVAVDGLLAPGELRATKKAVFVGTGSAGEVLRIEAIQPPGKKMMAAADWARGQQVLLDSEPSFD